MTNVCFLKKTSVFGITCEVNVEVNNGLILTYLFYLLDDWVNVDFFRFSDLFDLERKNQLINR